MVCLSARPVTMMMGVDLFQDDFADDVRRTQETSSLNLNHGVIPLRSQTRR
jgi:hypothetical protein